MCARIRIVPALMFSKTAVNRNSLVAKSDTLNSDDPGWPLENRTGIGNDTSGLLNVRICC